MIRIPTIISYEFNEKSQMQVEQIPSEMDNPSTYRILTSNSFTVKKTKIKKTKSQDYSGFFYFFLILFSDLPQRNQLLPAKSPYT